jgi:hypothetical protein
MMNFQYKKGVPWKYKTLFSQSLASPISSFIDHSLKSTTIFLQCRFLVLYVLGQNGAVQTIQVQFTGTEKSSDQLWMAVKDVHLLLKLKKVNLAISYVHW